jgi:hypothetical protein
LKNGSEAAFASWSGATPTWFILRRFDWSAATRIWPQDVTQTVFIDLARMARKLSSQVMLGGWLHRHTCFVAATVIRGERRRQSRERQAVENESII